MPKTADLDQGFDRLEKKQRPITPNPWLDKEFNKMTAFGREPGFHVDDIPERLGLLHEDSPVSLSGKEFAKGSIGSGILAHNSVTSANIYARSITSDKVAQAAITASLIGEEFKILEILDALPAAGTAGRLVFLTTDGKIYRDNGTAWVVLIMPGDVAAHIGGIDIPTVDTAAIADGAIETAKIAAEAVEEAKVATGAISAAKIVAGAISAGKIAAGAVTTAKLDALAITAEKIAALAIETDKLAANAITAAKIAANTITADEIAANAVTADIIAANAVIADKIAANAIAAVNIIAGTITADRLVLSQRVYWYSGASTTTRNSNDAEKYGSGGTYTKIKETKINEVTGEMRIYFELLSDGGAAVRARIYKNGVALGTIRLTSEVSYQPFTEDLGGFEVDDLIQIYVMSASDTAYVCNFRFQYDRAVTVVAGANLVTGLPTVEQTAFSMTNQDP